MIDPLARKSLSQDVRRLVTGRMTNDGFDDVYYATYDSSDDHAVRQIASSSYSLYSSDVLFPYRLRGCHAVDAETRSAAARAVLFLRSGLEYEWPPMPDNVALRVLAGLALFLGIPAGIALLLVCIPALLSGAYDVAVPLAIVGLLLLAGSATLTFWWPTFLADDWKSFRESGDYDVWPFLRQGDFDHARQECHLLGK